MSGRTYFIDRLRVVLTALVIVFHTAIAYGAAGGWYWREVDDLGRPLSIALTVFNAVCQSFFMGMFFLLAGYFTPAAFDRKGMRQFAIDRLLRLGVPLLVYGLLIGTATSAMVRSQLSANFLDLWFGMIAKGSFNFGPLWFAEALLLFTAGYLLWQLVWRRLSDNGAVRAGAFDKALPSWRWWLLSAVGVGFGSLLIRVWFPLGRDVAGMNIGYFSSYIFLFSLGCMAWRYRWLERVDRAQAKVWGIVALLVFPALPIVAATSGIFSGEGSKLAGGWSLADITYAFWDPFLAWGIIAMLLWQFRRRFNQPSVRWEGWASGAYGAYVVHPPIVVGLSLSLRGWDVATAAKFAVVSISAVVLSFAVSWSVKQIPGVNRVL